MFFILNYCILSHIVIVHDVYYHTVLKILLLLNDIHNVLFFDKFQ